MKKQQSDEKKKLVQAVTHIRLRDTNRSKLAALDALSDEYMRLCQQYVRHFCATGAPDRFANPLFDTPLSQRWQRVAMMQAAGVAQSWLTNRQKHHDDYQERQARYKAHKAQFPDSQRKAPVWKEPNVPTLHNVCIQANENVVTPLDAPREAVVKLEAVAGTKFDFWLQIATLTSHKPIFIPVQLADYHREALAGRTLNSSTQLNRRKDGSWWLTVTFDHKPDVKSDVPVVGVDIGISNFLTSSTGGKYGSFKGGLSRRHKLDRAKRQRKAKLRACLQKKGVEKLPSISSASGERLTRHVRQSINRAINWFFDDHPYCTVAMEHLSVSGMRFKARAMNAYLYASNLGHIPEQLEWAAAKRGLPVVFVNPAYSSQECSRCHFVSPENRPNQQTFCCQVCGYKAHADVNASSNLARRAEDEALRACRTVEAVKALLLERHQHWRDGCP
jgi:IS605 OrfB family transposase